MNDPDSAAADRLARRAGAAMYESDRTARALGIELEHVAAGEARLAMRVRDDMVNGHDVCHGGLTFTLADTAMAYASNSYNRVALAQIATIQFTAPGRRGERLVAEASESFGEGRTGIYDVVVRGEDGRTIALFRGTTRQVRGEIVSADVEAPESEVPDAEKEAQP